MILSYRVFCFIRGTQIGIYTTVPLIPWIEDPADMAADAIARDVIGRLLIGVFFLVYGVRLGSNKSSRTCYEVG